MKHALTRSTARKRLREGSERIDQRNWACVTTGHATGHEEEVEEEGEPLVAVGEPGTFG